MPIYHHVLLEGNIYMNLEQFISGQADRNHDFPKIVKFLIEQLIVMHMKKTQNLTKLYVEPSDP